MAAPARVCSPPIPALPLRATLRQRARPGHAGRQDAVACRNGRADGISPITYELDGRQYIVTASGGVLFAWVLPPGKIFAGQERAAAAPAR